MNVGIFRGGKPAVPFHNGGAVLRVVEEMEAVAALDHMDDCFAMEGVFRAGIGDVSIAVVGKTVFAGHALSACK